MTNFRLMILILGEVMRTADDQTFTSYHCLGFIELAWAVTENLL